MYSNFNFQLILYLFPIIGLLKWFYSFKRERVTEIKEEYSIKVEFYFDCLIYVSLFTLTYALACSLVYYQHGDLTNIASEFLGFLSLAFILVVWILFFLYPGWTIRFRGVFEECHPALIHYHWHIICIILYVVLLGCLELPWPPLLPQAVTLIYTLIYRPYKELLENLFSAFVYFLLCGATSLRILFYYDEGLRRSYICPLIMEIVLLVGIALALFIIIKDLLTKRTSKEIVFDLFGEK